MSVLSPFLESFVHFPLLGIGFSAVSPGPVLPLLPDGDRDFGDSSNYLDLEKCNDSELLMAITVEENSQRLQKMMGSPSQRDFEGMVHHNLIKNCPVDQKDVTNAYNIFFARTGRSEREDCEKEAKNCID